MKEEIINLIKECLEKHNYWAREVNVNTRCEGDIYDAEISIRAVKKDSALGKSVIHLTKHLK